MTIQALPYELKEIIYLHTDGKTGPVFSAVCTQFRKVRFTVMRQAALTIIESVTVLPDRQGAKDRLSASKTIQEISLTFTKVVLDPLKSFSAQEEKSSCEQLFSTLVLGRHVELLKLACRHLKDAPTLQPLIYRSLLLVEQPDAAEHYCPNLIDKFLLKIEVVKHLVLNGRLNAADELLKHISWSNPEKCEAFQNLVIALANSNRLDEAFTLFCEMHKNTHQRNDAGIALVKKFLEIKRADRAFDCWKLLWFRQMDCNLCYTLLEELLKSNMVDKAKVFAADQPDYLKGDFRFSILRYLIQEKQWDEAFSFLEPQKGDSESFHAFHLIPELLKSDRVDQALTLFRSMTSWKDVAAKPLVSKLSELSRFDDAISCMPYLSSGEYIRKEIILPLLSSLLAKKCLKKIHACLLACRENERITLTSELFRTVEQRHIVPLYDLVPDVAEKIDPVAITQLFAELIARRRLGAAETLLQRYDYSKYSFWGGFRDDMLLSLIKAWAKKGQFEKAIKAYSSFENSFSKRQAIDALIAALLVRKKFDLAATIAEKEPSPSSYFSSIVTGLVKNKSVQKLQQLLPRFTFSTTLEKDKALNGAGRLFVEQQKWHEALDCLERCSSSSYYSELRDELVSQVIEANCLEEFKAVLPQFAGCGSDVAACTACQLADRMDFTAAGGFAKLCRDPGLERHVKLHILKQRALSLLPSCTIV